MKTDDDAAATTDVQPWLILVIAGLCCITLSAIVSDPSFYVSSKRHTDVVGVQDTIHTRRKDFHIVATYEHDPSAFTEGFLFDDGRLLESTGRSGKSFVREVKDITSGYNVTQELQLPSSFFGEGIAIIGEKLYMLTYKAKTGFIYHKDTFESIGNFTFETETGEGWGMTTDGTHLIVSDGSEYIFYWDPDTMKVIKKIPVMNQGARVKKVNELEYVNGHIWFNVWFKNHIYACDETGLVIHHLDLTELVPQVSNLNTLKGNDKYNAVMNGIAFNPSNSHLFITGKLWNKIFELYVPVIIE